MTEQENTLRAVRFEYPERIPVRFGFNPSCWYHYEHDALQDLMEAHPLLFPDFKRQSEPVTPELKPWQVAGQPYTDSFGCVWETAEDGIIGTVSGHPLSDWSLWDDYSFPDPEVCNGLRPMDWDAFEATIRQKKVEHRYCQTNLRHGHTFLQLTYLRGYENLIFDMADDETKLWELIDKLEAFNAALVKRELGWGLDAYGFPEDLGMQNSPMLSPEHFRKYIKPSYKRLMTLVRDAGAVVHMHCDGYIRDLVFDLIDAGVESINLQDLVNGIDWIRDNLKGKVCIDLDIDRQKTVLFGTPEQIDSLIHEEVKQLGSKEGGLALRVDAYYGIPLKNLNALMDALEKYAGYYN